MIVPLPTSFHPQALVNYGKLNIRINAVYNNGYSAILLSGFLWSRGVYKKWRKSNVSQRTGVRSCIVLTN